MYLVFPQTKRTRYLFAINAIFNHQLNLLLFLCRNGRFFLRDFHLKNVFLHDFILFLLLLQPLGTICKSLIIQNLRSTILLIKLFLQSLFHFEVYVTAVYLLDGLVELFLLLLVTHPYVIFLMWKTLILISSFWQSRRTRILIFYWIWIIVFLHIFRRILLIQNINMIEGTFRRWLIRCSILLDRGLLLY